MKLLASLAIVAAASSAVAGHALDEYVQAARVAVSAGTIAIHFDLTPGAAVAPAIVGRIDADADGVVSPAEAEAYGRALERDLTVVLDGAPLPIALQKVEAPTTGEMREGLGTIRVSFSAASIPASSGRRVLELRNAHLPEHSVYLANALMPETAEVSIVKQERDVRQQTYRLEYEVRGSTRASGWWLFIAAGGLLVHARWRLR